ncbi:hypothetical protein E2C01_094492 [Portunus trituberculatus]|uniref:Uncharacterized protein n=1 Tax=Portunus trituberculatus TaxID=210409 RepID=A0A5B7JXR4_PORTR|nr:hypothetical protein [Portunus trituberculatus]
MYFAGLHNPEQKPASYCWQACSVLLPSFCSFLIPTVRAAWGTDESKDHILKHSFAAPPLLSKGSSCSYTGFLFIVLVTD